MDLIKELSKLNQRAGGHAVNLVVGLMGDVLTVSLYVSTASGRSFTVSGLNEYHAFREAHKILDGFDDGFQPPEPIAPVPGPRNDVECFA